MHDKTYIESFPFTLALYLVTQVDTNHSILLDIE